MPTHFLFSSSSSSFACSQASKSFGFWPISRLLLPVVDSKRCGGHVPVRMASSTMRRWRRRRTRLRITIADDTASRRTRVAASDVYDRFIDIRGVPVRGSGGPDMTKSNKERRKRSMAVVMVRDQGARRLPRKVYTDGGKTGMWEVIIRGQSNP